MQLEINEPQISREELRRLRAQLEVRLKLQPQAVREMGIDRRSAVIILALLDYYEVHRGPG